MTRKALILLILSGFHVAHGHYDDMTKEQWAMQGSYWALQAADCYLTLQLKHNPHLQEANPVLGTDPTDKQIYTFCGLTMLFQSYVTLTLPTKWRNYWLLSNIGLRLFVVGNNRGLVLGKRF